MGVCVCVIVWGETPLWRSHNFKTVENSSVCSFPQLFCSMLSVYSECNQMQTQLKSQCPLWQPNEKQETFQTLEPKIFREPEAEHDACKSEYVSPASATEVYL